MLPPAFVTENSWGSASKEQNRRINNVFKNRKAEKKKTSVIELGEKKMKKVSVIELGEKEIH